jgi:hypothetical protein
MTQADWPIGVDGNFSCPQYQDLGGSRSALDTGVLTENVSGRSEHNGRIDIVAPGENDGSCAEYLDAYGRPVVSVIGEQVYVA